MRAYTIIGLGNPGKKYINTRHNVGFMIVDVLEKEDLKELALAKTETFMNLSGSAVKKLMKKRGLRPDNLILVHDDIDIPLGEFKIQKGKSSAGHKGVQSIINELGTKDFYRARIGVCPKRGKPENVEKFVLQNFTREEKEIIKKLIDKMPEEIRKMV